MIIVEFSSVIITISNMDSIAIDHNTLSHHKVIWSDQQPRTITLEYFSAHEEVALGDSTVVLVLFDDADTHVI